MLNNILNNMYNKMYSLNNIENYEIDVPSVQSTLNIFKEQFLNLTKLNTNDKIYFDSSNIIQITPASYFQSFSRWYNSYKRAEIIEHLDICLKDYFKFCDMLLYYKLPMQKHEMDLLFNQIYNESKSLLLEINEGIKVLIETYKNDEEIIKQLNSIITKITSMTILHSIIG